MNEFCRIGLHGFTEWNDKEGKGLRQTRRCRACNVVEQRSWEPSDSHRPPYDPYADLTK